MVFKGPLKYLVLFAFSALFFMLNACTFNGLGVVLPYMVQELGWAWAVAGLGFTFLGLSCGLASLAPAIAIRKIGIAKTMLLGGAVLAVGFICMAIAQSSYTYFLGTILLGIGFALCGTTAGVNVVSHSFRRSSTAVGIYFTAGGLGAVAGPLIVYATQEWTGEWRYYWVGAAVCAVLLSIFAAIVTTDRPKLQDEEDDRHVDRESGGWTARSALRTAQYYIVVGAYTAFLLINTTVHGFAVQHLSESGLTMGGAATVMSAIALVSAAGSAAAGLAGERMTPRHVAMLSLTATVIGTLALIGGGSWFTIPVTVLGLGIGFGFSYVSTAMLLIDLFGKRPNLELYSIMSLISTTAAIGPALGGMVRDENGSFSVVFLGCAALGFIFLVLLTWMRRPEEPELLLDPALDDAGQRAVTDTAQPVLAA
ncbi:MFS transporter [Altericroceibacterium spongiae]|uniref:MFS transporter n=1 Tax=Altericroceibacterium spongiae TaxID=2320269 RepID=A0A420ER13_9SPHN|nr:MFS transporter [Altericroceibacterium spongiae]RKF23136.1 MFS transporter [Altericroceibacterium spongiae]